eukprot:s429_g4.t2
MSGCSRDPCEIFLGGLPCDPEVLSEVEQSLVSALKAAAAADGGPEEEGVRIRLHTTERGGRRGLGYGFAWLPTAAAAANLVEAGEVPYILAGQRKVAFTRAARGHNRERAPPPAEPVAACLEITACSDLDEDFRKQTPVLLFNGKKDNEVYKRTMVDTFHQLQYFVDAKFLHTAFETDAAHVWSVDHGNCDCGACSDFMDKPICCDVNNCVYDLSGDMLRKIYGPLRERVQVHPVLRRINQWKYVPRRDSDVNTTTGSTQTDTAQARNRHGMWHWALAYVPRGCVGKVHECRVHVNYHGCIRKTLQRRRLWASSIDLNEYGEANNIVMLYPQAAGSDEVGIGCWNWGDDSVDPQFDTKLSYQLRTVMNMLSDLENALAEADLLYPEEPARHVAEPDASHVPTIMA